MFTVFFLNFILGDDGVQWTDINVTGAYGGSKGCVVKVWDQEAVVYSARIFLSGLVCQGVLLPLPVTLPDRTLLFYMSGSYFAALNPDDDSSGAMKPWLEPPRGIPYLNSCDTNLLARLLRMHRALTQQISTNKQLYDSLACRGLDLEASKNAKVKSKTLRDQVFGSPEKETATRISELDLKRRIEVLKMRLKIRQQEKLERDRRLEPICQEIYNLKAKSKALAQSLTSRRKSLTLNLELFTRWKANLDAEAHTVKLLVETVRIQQLRYISDFKMTFPIQALNFQDFLVKENNF